MSRVAAATDAFHAIADPTRRAMLDRLRTGELSAGDLAEGIQLSQPALSKHLRVLRDSGLVSVREEGRFRYYGLVSPAMREVADWVGHFETFWPDKLEGLGKHLRRKARE
jgi:DNA-binding transcriptional ArsR family regulator